MGYQWPAAELLAKEWPPPFVLEGDTWCFLGVVPAGRLGAGAGSGGGRPLSFLGLAPVVLQATRYERAASLVNGRAVAYDEVSLTAVHVAPGGRWELLPLRLLVPEGPALELGLVYGFPKEAAPVVVRPGARRLWASVGEGRGLVGARLPLGVLLQPLRLALARLRVRVALPLRGSSTRFQFRKVARMAPAVGWASAAMRRWALGVWLLPMGVAVQGFSFRMEGPAAG